VEDFRPIAPIVYRFKFTTSQFANFFHHIHSFQDETWHIVFKADPPSDPSESAEMANIVGNAVELNTPTSDVNETKSFDRLAEYALGYIVAQNPKELKITRIGKRIENNKEIMFAFLVQSPDPIDWKRTSLQVLRSNQPVDWFSELPQRVKLTDVTFGTTTNQPTAESVTLLLREAANLTGYRIEYRLPPLTPVDMTAGDSVKYCYYSV
jgi:hypothetical protein